MTTEPTEKERCGCMAALGTLAIIIDAIVCRLTGEITIVETVLMPIVIVGTVYWTWKYIKENKK